MNQQQIHLPSIFKVWLSLAISVLIYFAALYLPFGSFTSAGKHTFAVFCVASYLWASNTFPLAVTGIMVLLLLPLGQSIDANEVYSYFGNTSVFFILGAFILASAIMRSGLTKRIAISIIARFGTGPKRLAVSIFLLSSLLAFVISEHAVAAMILPIVLEIVTAAKVSKRSRFAFASYMAMAWGAMIGGTATLLGGARAPLALAILQDTLAGSEKMSLYQSISFSQWTLWVIPAVVAMLICALLLVLLIAHKSKVDIVKARNILLKEKELIGKITQREIVTLMVSIIIISMWVFYGGVLGLDWIALFAVILVFSLKLTSWRGVEKDVQWGIIVMYGCAISLSVALRNTGAAHELVLLVMGLGIQSPMFIIILLIILAAILTEIMSNAASVAILLPIGLALAVEYGIDPRVVAIAIATSAGMTFMLPVSTPAMALVVNSDYVRLHEALGWGILLKFASVIFVIATVVFYWPLMGISVTV